MYRILPYTVIALAAIISSVPATAITGVTAIVPVSVTQVSELPSSSFAPFTERFEQAVNTWIAELSKQTEYANWKHAKWRRQPLGPGMHGWIVLITKQEKTIGYMVVSVDDAGKFQLSEYGLGEYQI